MTPVRTYKTKEKPRFDRKEDLYIGDDYDLSIKRKVAVNYVLPSGLWSGKSK
jgi:hypothetical protein